MTYNCRLQLTPVLCFPTVIKYSFKNEVKCLKWSKCCSRRKTRTKREWERKLDGNGCPFWLVKVSLCLIFPSNILQLRYFIIIIVVIIIIIIPSKVRLSLKIAQDRPHVNTPTLSYVRSQDKLQACLTPEHNLADKESAW